MIDEIKEQSEVIKKIFSSCFDKNLNLNKNYLPNFEVKKYSKIYIVASGSSRNAANITKYLIEEFAQIPVIVDFASEFAHRTPALTLCDLVIIVSQSGETADTYAALKIAKDEGVDTLAFTNKETSKIHQEARFKIYLNAGEEKSIAATKSFSAQVINLIIFAIYFAKSLNSCSEDILASIINDFSNLNEKIDKIFEQTDKIKAIAQKIKDSKSIVLLGRQAGYALAQEGALKIKETCYIDANGYPSGEFIHGYIAVLDENIPVISTVLKNEKSYNLAIGNLEKIKTDRNPYFIIIKQENDNEITSKFEKADFIDIPECSYWAEIVLSIIVLQFLAFQTAEAKGLDPSKPRSLTKVVAKE